MPASGGLTYRFTPGTFYRADAHSVINNTAGEAFSVDIQKTLIEFCKGTLGKASFDLPDPIAMAVALDHTVATTTMRARVEVDQDNAKTHMRRDGDPQVDVVVEASRARFLALLRESEMNW